MACFKTKYASPSNTSKTGGQYASPLELGSVTFSSDTELRYTFAASGDLPSGPNLHWKGSLKALIPSSSWVQITLTHFAGDVSIIAYNDADVKVTRAVSSTPDGAADTITLTSDQLTKVVLSSPGEGILRSFCYGNTNSLTPSPSQMPSPQPSPQPSDKPSEKQPQLPPVEGCLNFQQEKAGDRPGEFSAGGMTFSIDGIASVIDLTGDGILELYFTGRLKTAIPSETSHVEATFVHYGDQVTMEAFDVTGASKGIRITSGDDGTIEPLAIDAEAPVIRTVMLSTNGKAALLSLCSGETQDTGGKPPSPEPDQKPVPSCTKAPFVDIPASHPACGAVKLLVDARVVGGYQDGTFRPDQPVSRAEFAKLLVTAQGLKPLPSETVPFSDVQGHWVAASGYLQAAVRAGAISGYPDSTFKPDGKVTHAEAVAAIAKLMGVKPEEHDRSATETGSFSDIPGDAWYRPYVEKLEEKEIIGTDALFPIFNKGRFSGNSDLTREVAASLLGNLIEYLRSAENWDFELGNLSRWTFEGDDFSDQPVEGDPWYRDLVGIGITPVPLGGDYWYGPFPNGHQGHYWFSTYGVNRTGRLISEEFTIDKPYISFLVSGNQDENRLRVELWIQQTPEEQNLERWRTDPWVGGGSRRPSSQQRGDFILALFSTGNGSEIMSREVWNVGHFRGRRAQIHIVDNADAPGGIAVDDFRFSDERPSGLTIFKGGRSILLDPNTPVWGFADLHAHLMAHLGFGGVLFSGEPDRPDGRMDLALSSERDAELHGVGGTGVRFVPDPLLGIRIIPRLSQAGNAFIAFFEEGVGHANGGWPTFDGWPNFRTKIHQQMYIDWIRRAYDGGLRLMVALAVNNELLAKEFGDRRPYDDVTVVDGQIRAMKEMVDRHRDWMEIAYSPADARRIIHSNKLAIILGVEVDALGNCKRPTDCTEGQIRNYLQHLYDQGVRQITPIHLTNNAFGGAAIYNDMFNVLNHFLTGHYFNFDRESNYRGATSGVEFRLGEDEPLPVKWYRLSGVYNPGDLRPLYPGEGHVNYAGITNLGRYLLNEMMNRGMLIDIDHMSQRMTNEVLDMFERRGYPPVSSHTGFRHLAWRRGETSAPHNEKLPNESQKTRWQLERIRNLGGIIAPISNQHDIRDGRVRGPVPNDCPGSSKTWAQAYLNAVDIMRGRGVAIGTDFNGLAGQPGPRFGTFACPGLRNDEIRNRSLARRTAADVQRNGVRYQTPIRDYRAYRFAEAENLGTAVEGIFQWTRAVYNMDECDIWEAIAIYKSGTDPTRAEMPGLSERTPIQQNKIRNMAKGFRAERYEQLEDPTLFGGDTFVEQLAAFMVKSGESVWRSDHRIVEHYNRNARLRELYPVIQRIWNKYS